jgi:hypothetical protein
MADDRRDMVQNDAKMAPGDVAPPGTAGTGENVCPECSGTGKIGERACGNCAGTGIVIDGISGG